MTVQMISTVVFSWNWAAWCPSDLRCAIQRIEHHAEHADEDDDADPEDQVVQRDDFLRDRRGGRLEIPVRHRERGDRHEQRSGDGGAQEPPRKFRSITHDAVPRSRRGGATSGGFESHAEKTRVGSTRALQRTQMLARIRNSLARETERCKRIGVE